MSPTPTEHASGDWSSDCAQKCLPSFFDGLESKFETSLLSKAMELLRENPDAYVSVEEWAGDVGVSREHLTRSLTPTINPHALLQATRVCLALSELAKQETLHAGKALKIMGYNSRAHAFSVFKKTTGLTPSEFWELLHAPTVHHACVVQRCPLVGAVLDRYRRQVKSIG